MARGLIARAVYKFFDLTFALSVTVGSCHFGYAQPRPTYKDIVYARVGGKPFALDIYLPAGVASPSLVVWVHGGAWRSGTKEGIPPALVGNSFAIASVDFHQSTEAPFPAAVHDIKGAIRFLRANAKKYGYDASRIAIAGSSSGGHLAILVGVTNGNKVLEGVVGNNPDQSSDVQAIVDYYGASNLTTILSQSTPHGLSVRKPALELLLGALPENATELAKLASPVFHIDSDDPPLLIIHGDQDPQMPINQAHELAGQYIASGLDVYFDVVYGGAHGGDLFYSPEHLERVLAFLHRTIE